MIKPTADINGRPAARAYFLSRTNKMIAALRSAWLSNEEQLALGQFLQESRWPEGIVLDGEAMVKGMDFNASSGRLRSDAQLPLSQLTYVLYGVLPASELEASETADLSLSNVMIQVISQVTIHQLKELLKPIDWQLAESWDVYDMEQINELFEEQLSLGREGLVLKDPMAPWKRGKKTGWWKVKNEDTIDGNVVGVVWGTEGKANEGKVIGFEVLLENGVVVNACGLTQDQMVRFTSNIKLNPDYYKDWAVQVKFMERTPDGSLRHPSFDCWRGMAGHETEKM
ncbi:DNA ligase [Escherichia phage vB_Eco_Bam]|uniref:DNA ligase n=1 Tax=Escherichia phage vB_Eco_Bam TaxID=2898833 RepID=A0A9P0VDH5_9CAUD|nr:DNA ligase [Escherichia phage vB_Eco_Bam]